MTVLIDKLAHHLIHTLGRGRMFLGSAAVENSLWYGGGRNWTDPVEFSGSQGAPTHVHDHLDDVQIPF